MRLARLESYGFKSFAERIRIDFDEGITAIVVCYSDDGGRTWSEDRYRIELPVTSCDRNRTCDTDWRKKKHWRKVKKLGHWRNAKI